MGCLAFKQKKHDRIDSNSVSTVDQLNDLKITGSQFVQEGSGDPFTYYEVLKPLGEGSYGKVYKVRNRKTGVILAMKEIIKNPTMERDLESNLIKEIKILMMLDHPNILKVYEYFNTKRKLYLISELCTGGELFDHIVSVNYFNEKVSAHIFKQILSAINFCHFNKIIHRDLKPENILVENESEKKIEYFNIKVIDFGTSDIIIKNNKFSKLIGTPLYMAPEILDNSYNEKCDLWSCGVILYILISGEAPFFGDHDQQMLKNVYKGKFTFESDVWKEVSEDAKDLIKNLMNKDVNQRYTAEQALNHIWFEKMKDKSDGSQLSKETLDKISKNLAKFNYGHKLQQAVLAFIVRNLVKNEDCNELRKAFNEFDENNDGHLSKEELEKGLLKVMTPSEAKNEVNRIMSMIDSDNNGYIEYEEFLRATLNKESILCESNLQAAFSVFDKDKSGKISSEEIKNFLGGQGINDKIFNEMIRQLDINGDGEISYKEFKEIMGKILNNYTENK